MGLHVAQMTSQAAMRQCFDAVTVSAQQVMGLDNYGIAPGCHADLVLLQPPDPVARALRLRATRTQGVAARPLLAETAPVAAQLRLPGRPGQTSWQAAEVGADPTSPQT